VEKFTWDALRAKYQPGTEVRQLLSARTFKILKVDDEAVYFKWAVVTNGKIQRCNLERMAELIEDNVVRKDVSTLVNDYRTLVGDERPSTAIAILKDMGVF
jgi:hypothetical protein